MDGNKYYYVTSWNIPEAFFKHACIAWQYVQTLCIIYYYYCLFSPNKLELNWCEQTTIIYHGHRFVILYIVYSQKRLLDKKKSLNSVTLGLQFSGIRQALNKLGAKHSWGIYVYIYI